MSPAWPGRARAALALSFDNLGEAAEIGAGALDCDAAGVGTHPTATEVVPALLDRLDAAGLRATFFVEGLNAELYPELLKKMDERGHEVAYHAWAHEQWGELTADEQSLNLDDGIVAFAQRLDIDLLGFRPPGGGLGEAGVAPQRDLGFHYASPAGRAAGIQDGLVLLPFAWRHVDVTCVLPQLATVREQMVGSSDPIAPDRFLAFLETELRTLIESGGFMGIVLHPFMLGWFGEERLISLLERIATASASGDLWVTPFRDIAAQVRLHSQEFEGATILDVTTWTT